jgi:hypothetical protein
VKFLARSKGKRQRDDEVEESYAERERNREAATTGAEENARQARLAAEHSLKLREEKRQEQRRLEKQNMLSWKQKVNFTAHFKLTWRLVGNPATSSTLSCGVAQEKRKRDLGQADKQKNYVEEEKRLARNYGKAICGIEKVIANKAVHAGRKPRRFVCCLTGIHAGFDQ